MKIIVVDNYDRGSFDDKVICENINEPYGKLITDFLNNKYSGDNSDYFYKLVPDDYKLFERDY